MEIEIGDIVRFADGREGTITNLKRSDVIERVRFTRFDEAHGANVTTWMSWKTFRKKNPVVISAQLKLW